MKKSTLNRNVNFTVLKDEMLKDVAGGMMNDVLTLRQEIKLIISFLLKLFANCGGSGGGTG